MLQKDEKLDGLVKHDPDKMLRHKYVNLKNNNIFCRFGNFRKNSRSCSTFNDILLIFDHPVLTVYL